VIAAVSIHEIQSSWNRAIGEAAGPCSWFSRSLSLTLPPIDIVVADRPASDVAIEFKNYRSLKIIGLSWQPLFHRCVPMAETKSRSA
jgi:hypothetical protein